MKPDLKTIALALMPTLALALPSAARAEPAAALNTASIVSGAAGAAASCLRFRVVGTCVWLVGCPYCELDYTVKYGHRNPDVVVSVTNGLGKNPWAEAASAYSSIDSAGASSVVSGQGGSLLGGIGGIETGSNSAAQKEEGFGRKSNLSYREAQAVGHPLAGEIYCPSSASYFNPYFLSGLDALAWRWQLPEVAYPQSLVPGLREVGDWPLNTWGAVYPRSGWLAQPDQPKAAAVAAQRVGDIITRGQAVHISQELASGGMEESDNKLVWRPEALKEGDDKTGDWQMLAPNADTGCAVFGADDTLSPAGWSGGKLAAGGDYAWTLWRPYSCCKTMDGIFLGYIDILPYP